MAEDKKDNPTMAFEMQPRVGDSARALLPLTTPNPPVQTSLGYGEVSGRGISRWAPGGIKATAPRYNISGTKLASEIYRDKGVARSQTVDSDGKTLSEGLKTGQNKPAAPSAPSAPATEEKKAQAQAKGKQDLMMGGSPLQAMMQPLFDKYMQTFNDPYATAKDRMMAGLTLRPMIKNFADMTKAMYPSGYNPQAFQRGAYGGYVHDPARGTMQEYNPAFENTQQGVEAGNQTKKEVAALSGDAKITSAMGGQPTGAPSLSQKVANNVQKAQVGTTALQTPQSAAPAPEAPVETPEQKQKRLDSSWSFTQTPKSALDLTSI